MTSVSTWSPTDLVLTHLRTSGGRIQGDTTVCLSPLCSRLCGAPLCCSRIDEVILVDGTETNLATNFWKSGSVSPEGFKALTAFYPLPVPTWLYRVKGGLLIKQVAMMQEKQQVAVGYTWQGDSIRITTKDSRDVNDAEESALLQLHMLVNYRDFHSATNGSDKWHFEQHQESDLVRIRAFPDAQPLIIHFDRGTYTQSSDWYRDYYWPRESERGLEDREDCSPRWCVGN